jgi:hypothetical protein
MRLAAPPAKLPTAACRAVLTNLVKQGYVEECTVPDKFTGPRWHQQNGTRPTVRITDAGMAAIGTKPAATARLPDTEGAGVDADPADKHQGPDSAPLAPPAAAEPHTRTRAALMPSSSPLRRRSAPGCATSPAGFWLPGMRRLVSAPAWPTPWPPSAPFW